MSKNGTNAGSSSGAGRGRIGSKAAGKPGREIQINRLDNAFDRSRGARDNHVSLDEFRSKLGGTRAQQDKLIHAGRKARRFSLDTHEGLLKTSTPSQRAAAIHDRGSAHSQTGFIWISRNKPRKSRKK
jgi:hypothetical protein